MKVLIIIPSLGIGGAEEQVKSLSRSRSASNQFSFLLLYKNRNNDSDLSFSPHYLFENQSFIPLLTYIFTPFKLFKIRRYLSEFEVIHCNLTWGIWVGLCLNFFKFSRYLKHIKISMTIHFVFGSARLFSVFLHRIAFFTFDGIVLVINDARFLRNNRLAKGVIMVIENGVEFASSPKVNHFFIGEKLSSVNFGILSRLVTERNLEKGIQIFDIFQRLQPDLQVKLYLGGDGPIRANLEAFVQSLKSSHLVEFLGSVSNKDSFFSQVDIFITLTDHDYPGISGLEAISKGIPVFGYSNNLSNLISPIVSSSDEEFVALSIRNFLQSYELFKTYTEQQHKYYSKNYNITKMHDEYHRYFKILSNV